VSCDFRDACILLASNVSVNYQFAMVLLIIGGVLPAIIEGLYYSPPISIGAPCEAAFEIHLGKLETIRLAPRLLAGSRVFERARSEEELIELMKTCAIQNGWSSKDVEEMPVWLLTGHTVQDANPNFWQYSSF
jgi:hypothetical protein